MSDFECYCEPNEGEPCDLWQESWRKARKQHKCCECGETIQPGQRYQYIFIIFEGDPDYKKRCEFCANEVTRFLQDNPDFQGLVPGELACALVSEMRNGPSR